MTPTEPYNFTPLQLRFIEEYPKDCKKGPAARRAGCEPSNARQQGYEWYLNPHIRAAIDERMKQLSMSADEAVKHISDIASTRLNHYLKVVEKERGTQVLQSLSDAIAQAEEELDFEEQYTARAAALLGLTDEELEDHWAAFRAKQNKVKLQVLRWEMELERNPNAYHMIAGEPERYEDIEVDLVALAKAKAEGRIKTLSFSEHGPKVEMYPADAALRDIMKMGGLFVDRVELGADKAGISVTLNLGGPAKDGN